MHPMLDHEQPHIVAAGKPRWFKSPLASDRLRRPSEAHPHDQLLFKEHAECADTDEDGLYSGYPPFQRVAFEPARSPVVAKASAREMYKTC